MNNGLLTIYNGEFKVEPTRLWRGRLRVQLFQQVVSPPSPVLTRREYLYRLRQQWLLASPGKGYAGNRGTYDCKVKVEPEVIVAIDAGRMKSRKANLRRLRV